MNAASPKNVAIPELPLFAAAPAPNAAGTAQKEENHDNPVHLRILSRFVSIAYSIGRASAQFGPAFKSTFNGTRNAAAPAISSRTNRGQSRKLLGRHFKYQFIVNLQEHPRRQLLSPQPRVDGDHRQFDQVGRGALDDRVDGGPFGEVPGAAGIVAHSADRPPAAQDRINIPLSAAFRQDPDQEALDSRITRK